MAFLLGPKAKEQIRRLIQSEWLRLKVQDPRRARYTKRGGGGSTCNIQRRYVCSGGNLVEQWRNCTLGTEWTNSSTTPPPDE